jgi:hypothetical protein
MAAHYDLYLVALGPTNIHGVTLEVLQAAWPLRRDELLDDRSRPGARPWAWWEFDQCEARPSGYGQEVARLLELGELDEQEMTAILAAGDTFVRKYGLPWRIHGEAPPITDANVIRGHLGMAPIGYHEDQIPTRKKAA